LKKVRIGDEIILDGLLVKITSIMKCKHYTSTPCQNYSLIVSCPLKGWRIVANGFRCISEELVRAGIVDSNWEPNFLDLLPKNETPCNYLDFICDLTKHYQSNSGLDVNKQFVKLVEEIGEVARCMSGTNDESMESELMDVINSAFIMLFLKADRPINDIIQDSVDKISSRGVLGN
jgi:NTP pyrophosphatase (non-canonical NTP hydrolase)